jgi:hypothetical protein
VAGFDIDEPWRITMQLLTMAEVQMVNGGDAFDVASSAIGGAGIGAAAFGGWSTVAAAGLCATPAGWVGLGLIAVGAAVGAYVGESE